MTKQEAIAAMQRGEKVTHTYFFKEEWMSMKNNKIVFEDGVRMSPEEFWKEKTIDGWNDGYEIYKEEITYTVVPSLETLARINNTSKAIQVAPRFEELDIKTRDFILINLLCLAEVNDPYEADFLSLNKVLKKYPGTVADEWIKIHSDIMKKEDPSELNIKRIESLVAKNKLYL